MKFICCPTCGVFEGPCLDREGNSIATHASRQRLIDRYGRPAAPKRPYRRWPNPLARMRAYSKRNRDRRRAQGLCINSDNHGDATHGVLCASCRATHRSSERASAA